MRRPLLRLLQRRWPLRGLAPPSRLPLPDVIPRPAQPFPFPPPSRHPRPDVIPRPAQSVRRSLSLPSCPPRAPPSLPLLTRSPRPSIANRGPVAVVLLAPLAVLPRRLVLGSVLLGRRCCGALGRSFLRSLGTPVLLQSAPPLLLFRRTRAGHAHLEHERVVGAAVPAPIHLHGLHREQFLRRAKQEHLARTTQTAVSSSLSLGAPLFLILFRLYLAFGFL